MIHFSNPNRDKIFSSSQRRPDLSWNPPSLIVNGHRDQNCRGVKWTYLHVVPRLRMNGSIPPFPHMPLWYARGYFHFSSYFTNLAPLRQVRGKHFHPHERHNSVEERQACVKCNTYGDIKYANTLLLWKAGGIINWCGRRGRHYNRF
jgi:hypothetical protein